MRTPQDLPSLAVVRVITGGGPYRVGQTISLAFCSPSVGRLVAHDDLSRDVPAAFPDAIVPETIEVKVLHPASPFELGDVLALSFIDPRIARIHLSGEKSDNRRQRISSTESANHKLDSGSLHVRISDAGLRDDRLETSHTQHDGNATSRGEGSDSDTLVPSSALDGEARPGFTSAANARSGSEHRPVDSEFHIPYEPTALATQDTPLDRVELPELDSETIEQRAREERSFATGRAIEDAPLDCVADRELDFETIERPRNAFDEERAYVSSTERARSDLDSAPEGQRRPDTASNAESSVSPGSSQAAARNSNDERPRSEGLYSEDPAVRDDVRSNALWPDRSEMLRSSATDEVAARKREQPETSAASSDARTWEPAVISRDPDFSLRESQHPGSAVDSTYEDSRCTVAAGVRVRLHWSRERVKRFVGIVDKLFTVGRLGWYRHALAMRLLIPDEVTSGDALGDIEAMRHLHALRAAAVETLGRPLLAAFMPNFSVSTQWLATIDSVAAARALAGLREALMPYVADGGTLPPLEPKYTVGTMQRRELLETSAASVEAFLPVLIPTASPNVVLSDRLSDYRRMLIDAFSQTARSAETVRVNAMAQPNHALDDRLWQLVGAVAEAFDGLAVA